MGRIHRGGLVGLTWQPPSPTFCRRRPSLTPLAPCPPRRGPIGQRLQQYPHPGERPILFPPPQLATASSFSPQASTSTHAPVSPRRAGAGRLVPPFQRTPLRAQRRPTSGHWAAQHHARAEMASANWHHETRQWLPRVSLFNMIRRSLSLFHPERRHLVLPLCHVESSHGVEVRLEASRRRRHFWCAHNNAMSPSRVFGANHLCSLSMTCRAIEIEDMAFARPSTCTCG